jgi:hypothetical protein
VEQKGSGLIGDSNGHAPIDDIIEGGLGRDLNVDVLTETGQVGFFHEQRYFESFDRYIQA